MKFAKTLEDLMVPEWKTQYVAYKAGKKRIKATTARLRTISASPAVSALKKTAAAARPSAEHPTKEDADAPSTKRLSRGASLVRRVLAAGSTPARPTEDVQPPAEERSPLQTADSQSSYGTVDGDGMYAPLRPPSLTLPPPMQAVPAAAPEVAVQQLRRMSTAPVEVEDAGHDAELAKPPQEPELPRLNRMWTLRRSATQGGVAMPDIGQVQLQAEKEFLLWCCEEMRKCDGFYRGREEEALRRAEEMKEQLYIMRDRWNRARHKLTFEEDDVEDVGEAIEEGKVGGKNDKHGRRKKEEPGERRRRMPWRTVSQAMNTLTHAKPTVAQCDTSVHTRGTEERRDYERRPQIRQPINNPAHRVAKHKLKKAYIEFYHSLEMLKSYVTVNRECFRKITKKFDKASGLRTSYRFMTEYVDKSYFGGPNRLDDLINETEELFAVYFERGNRKEAAVRLRSRENKAVYYDSVWRSGFFLGLAIVIAIYATYEAARKINGDDEELALRTGYLLQIWGGVALVLAQVLLFAVNLKVWAKHRINYSFIFEFDQRTQLNYRQFLEIPAVFALLFAVVYWFSTYDFWADSEHGVRMVHFPIIFVCVAGVLLVLPFKVFYYHSRRWFLHVLYRLTFSGLFPVEFKDFWMGDMFCSLTYALGNIELFFCLYARDWHEPQMCNSSHSRLMGFFTALPGIWRLLQCIRRYYSSRAAFPHLANAGKYLFTILYYMTLSIWRIDTSFPSAKAAFIFCASVNSIYTTVWDIVMDWSLLDPYAPHPLLRHELAFKSPLPYYTALLLDPPLRCTWILYLVFAARIQHSALLSFLISLAEVARRFMWAFFRMENEHIGNVEGQRATREVPLPYHFAKGDTPPCTRPVSSATAAEDVEAAGARDSGLGRTRTRIANAHMQDYERRRTEEEEVGASSSDEEAGEEEFGGGGATGVEHGRRGGVRERRVGGGGDENVRPTPGGAGGC